MRDRFGFRGGYSKHGRFLQSAPPPCPSHSRARGAVQEGLRLPKKPFSRQRPSLVQPGPRLAPAEASRQKGIWTSEDKIADTIIPRVDRMGAGPARLTTATAQSDAGGKDRPLHLSCHLARAAQRQSPAALMTIGPVAAALRAGNSVDWQMNITALLSFSQASGASGSRLWKLCASNSAKWLSHSRRDVSLFG